MQDGAIRSNPCSETIAILRGEYSAFVSNQNDFSRMQRKIRPPRCVSLLRLRTHSKTISCKIAAATVYLKEGCGPAKFLLQGCWLKTRLPHSDLIVVIIGPN